MLWIDEAALHQELTSRGVAYQRPGQGELRFTYVPALAVACLSRSGDDASTDREALKLVEEAFVAVAHEQDDVLVGATPNGVSSLVLTSDLDGDCTGVGFSFGESHLLRSATETIAACPPILAGRRAELGAE